MRDVKIVTAFCFVDHKTVVEKKPASDHIRFRVLEIDFESRAVLERIVFAFEIVGADDSAVLAILKILRRKMEVCEIAFVLGIVTGRKTKISGARQLVDVFPERTQSFVSDGNVQPFGSIQGDEYINDDLVPLRF